MFAFIGKEEKMVLLVFFLRILSIFNTHTRGEGRRFFKEIYSRVYPKISNS